MRFNLLLSLTRCITYSNLFLFMIQMDMLFSLFLLFRVVCRDGLHMGQRGSQSKEKKSISHAMRIDSATHLVTAVLEQVVSVKHFLNYLLIFLS